MSDMSKEMKTQLMQELSTDASRMQEDIQRLMVYRSPGTNEYDYKPQDLDKLEYITAQMRLKLKLLGAGHIWTNVI